MDATGTSTSTAGKPTHWEQLLAVLDALRAELKANYVPAFLQRKLFVQLFSFINVQLFNQLLLRRECCSFANGEYVKNGLAQVRSCPSMGCCLCVLWHRLLVCSLCDPWDNDFPRLQGAMDLSGTSHCRHGGTSRTPKNVLCVRNEQSLPSHATCGTCGSSHAMIANLPCVRIMGCLFDILCHLKFSSLCSQVGGTCSKG